LHSNKFNYLSSQLQVFPAHFPGCNIAKIQQFFGFSGTSLAFSYYICSNSCFVEMQHFGRIIIAIGSNEEAVRLSGIIVSAYTFSVFAISGLTIIIAMLLHVLRKTAINSHIKLRYYATVSQIKLEKPSPYSTGGYVTGI
jgi:ribose/xylose/arabinose/galactoside ABC-type transport system permease subunit